LLVKGAFNWGWAIPRVAGLAAYLAFVFLVLFSVLVIMALVSTFMATPLIRLLMKGQLSLATPLGEPSAERGAT